MSYLDHYLLLPWQQPPAHGLVCAEDFFCLLIHIELKDIQMNALLTVTKYQHVHQYA